jgi:hypothetical protein
MSTDPADLVLEIRRLEAELAEALATIDNEHGLGEPPCEVWRFIGCDWWFGEPNKIGSIRVARGAMGAVPGGWEVWTVGRGVLEPRPRTARAAMRAAMGAKP